MACFSLALAAPGWLAAQARAPQRQSFDLQVPNPPTPARVAGSTQLAYELYLDNFAAEPLTLRRIAVLDAGSGAELGALQGEALRTAVGRPDRPAATADRLVVPPGVRVVAYLAPIVAAAPHALRQRVDYVAADGSPHTVEGGTVEPRRPSGAMLGPPLRGGPWAAVYGPDWERGHRRVLYAVGGAVHVPGRFAIDWIKLDDQGHYAHGDPSRPADWYGYGAEVLAVADATVAAAVDDMAEPATVAAGRKVPPEQASGNYVALDLGDGRYAFYEHLQPGSLRVKSGQRVRCGQVIARLGYTGESTGPHLHFHVADAAAPLDAEGLPYGLERFRLLGGYASIEAFGKEPWTPAPGGKATTRQGELPAPLAVVDFSDGGR
ncbi:hypothetical protein ASG87_02130 [Frateuria sp. Soil773]|nr:hypothetical protein ASG87_02130 [Frateuria sp. Soil773]